MVRNTSLIMFFLNRDCINNCILYFITHMYNNMLVDLDIHVIYLISRALEVIINILHVHV